MNLLSRFRQPAPPPPPPEPAGLRPVVTCEICGHRQKVERLIGEPQAFRLVCHECEGVLRVEVTDEDLEAAAATAAPP